MKLNLILCCFILLTGCSRLCKTDMGPANTFNAADDAFMPQAARANTGEIYLAQIALATSGDSTIRTLATEILTTHQNAQHELTALNTGGRPLPADTTPGYLLNARYLAGLSAASFDTAYLRVEISNFSMEILTYDNEITNGQFTAVKDYAARYSTIFKGQSDEISAALSGYTHTKENITQRTSGEKKSTAHSN